MALLFRLACVWGLIGLTAASAATKSGTAIVKSVTGVVSYADRNGISHPLTVGTVLQEGDSVRTGVGSTVDFDLPHNGPGVGLTPESALKFEKLSYEETDLGTVSDTRLDLTEGALVGAVNKLLARSRYEIKTPQGLATVRGTEFYVSAKTGLVYVVSGTVTVKIFLDVNNVVPPFGGDPSVYDNFKIVTVNAGQMFVMPRGFTEDALFQAVTGPPPPGILAKMDHYIKPGTAAEVSETYDTKYILNPVTGRAKEIVSFPPTITVSP